MNIHEAEATPRPPQPPRTPRPRRLTGPCPGDVLVSRGTASLEHDVSIVPSPPEIISASHDGALACAAGLARARGVDAWLSEDHRHFVRVASFREAPPPRRG